MNGPKGPVLTSVPGWPRGTLMSRLEPETADELLHLAVGQEYKPGIVLIRAGGPGTHAYLLRSSRRDRSACVKVTATSESGVEAMLGIRAGGDIVGELAVLGLKSRCATVTTCSTLIAHAIPAATFIGFLNRRPQAWSAVTLMIAERLEWANRRRVDHAGHDSTIQIARVIAEILEMYGHRTPDGLEELGVSLSQPELGSLVGTSKEAVAKSIKQLRELGLLKTSYRRIIVVDSARLRTFARLAER
jgi:CRP/FNR family transcriptional regulator, cyclic AMP receptor protein